MNRTALACTAIASASLILAAMLRAGPLDPPAGPVTSSYKTLTEVEPRTAISAANTPGDAGSVYHITQQGSYYLTGNLTGAAGKHIIKIDADNVTIDLNGFAMNGVGGSFDGINSPSNRRSLTIRNGTIRGNGSSGIFLSSSSGVRLDNLVVSNNTLDGVWPGTSATVSNVQVLDCARDGFVLQNTSDSTFTDCIAIGNHTGFKGPGADVIFTRCIARSNSVNGIEVAGGGNAIHCVATANTGWGFKTTGDRATFENCDSEANGAAGFYIQHFDCVISRCVARSNGLGTTKASGFFSGTDGVSNHAYRECTAFFNGKAGFEIGAARVSMEDCSANENGASGVMAAGQSVRIVDSRLDGNGQLGADLGQGSSVEGTTVQNNTADGLRINGNGNAVIRRCKVISSGGNGMVIANGSVVEDCLIAASTLSGVSGNTLSTVRRCTFDANGTAAGNLNPHLTFNGGGNLIEDNYIFGGDSGIVITAGGGSIVRRNIANVTANNYGGIVAGNRVAPINTSATLTTTNPNDNFSY